MYDHSMLRYVRIVDHNADNGVGGFILTFTFLANQMN